MFNGQVRINRVSGGQAAAAAAQPPPSTEMPSSLADPRTRWGPRKTYLQYVVMRARVAPPKTWTSSRA